MKLNKELMSWIFEQIKNCSGCFAGDSGEVHCILCTKNVLSTEELKETIWNDQQMMVPLPCAIEETPEDLALKRVVWKYNFKWVRAMLRKCNNMEDVSKLLDEVEKVKT